jgi:hypothetical protein
LLLPALTAFDLAQMAEFVFRLIYLSFNGSFCGAPQ